jgi:hypothetical protein
VFVRWSKWFVVLALVIATGGHWALLQSAAWVGMAVSFSRTDTVAVAFEKTFGGNHPCELCKLVKQGKAAEQKREMQKLETKFDFFAMASTCSLFPPKPFRHFAPSTECAVTRADQPVPPPPRTV